MKFKINIFGRRKDEAEPYKRVKKMIVEAEKNVNRSSANSGIDIFKMLEYSLKYNALARKVKKNDKWIWIVEIES